MENSNSSSSSKQRRLAIQIENPFALKMGQVFTGFGIGCGVGIGVGRPLNLGAIPALQQVMTATRGATDAFSGVGRHVNTSLRRLGAKSIEAGIGCGVGFGHGFGVGLAVKPGVVQRLHSSVMQGMAKMMMKFGVIPGLSIDQNTLPGSLQKSMRTTNEPSKQKLLGNVMHSASKAQQYTSQGPPLDMTFGSRTEKVISSFQQSSILKDEDTELNELAGRLRTENNMLQLLLKHQKVIEELTKENEKIRQILVEDLKVPPSKLNTSNPSRTN